jgi:hypothetical protein
MLVRVHRSVSRLAVCLASVFVVMPGGCALEAQIDTTRVTLSGMVVDPQQRPLEGVEVRLVGDFRWAGRRLDAATVSDCRPLARTPLTGASDR